MGEQECHSSEPNLSWLRACPKRAATCAPLPSIEAQVSRFDPENPDTKSVQSRPTLMLCHERLKNAKAQLPPTAGRCIMARVSSNAMPLSASADGVFLHMLAFNTLSGLDVLAQELETSSLECYAKTSNHKHALAFSQTHTHWLLKLQTQKVSSGISNLCITHQ